MTESKNPEIRGMFDTIEGYGVHQKEYVKAYDWVKTLSNGGIACMLHERIDKPLW